MNKGGRKRDSMWQYFNELTVDGKKVAECKECNEKVSHRADRIRLHIVKCLKNQDSTATSPAATTTPTTPELKRELSTSPTSSPTRKRQLTQRQTSLDFQVVRTSKETKKDLDDRIAKFFIACNIPFNAAEHSNFKYMID